MTLSFRCFDFRLFAIAALGTLFSCSQPESGSPGAGGSSGGGTGSAGTTGTAGTTGAAGGAGNGSGGSAGNAGTAGSGNSGSTGTSGTTGAAGSGATGTAGRGGASGAAGSGGSAGAAGSGSGGSTGTGGASGAVTITGLKIDPNPKNVLSCFVSWTTNVAASSTVQFGVDGYQFEIADAAQVTSHKVTVIGMKQMKTYKIKAQSGAASAEGTFMTMAVPASIPVASITAMDAAKVQPGWTLMNIQKGDGSASAMSMTPSQAVMYDVDGQPVWYYINGTTVDRGGAVSVDLTDKGVLFGATLTPGGTIMNAEPPREVDFAGNVVWQCSSPNCGRTGNLTHHVSKLPNGNYMMLRDVSESGGTTPNFEEVTPTNTVVWTVPYTKFVPKPSSQSGDWCHGNSITVNTAKSELYVNCRFMGLVKASYADRSFKWHLPAKYSGSGITNGMKFMPATSQYSDTHDPEIHDDGTILFFDNGGFSGTIEDGNPHNYHSRAVEYKIDETANTATLVWEFPGTFTVDSWYTTQFYVPFWGDADRLANGNVLVTAGRRGTMVRSRIFEVTKQDGKVVWEFQLPLDYGVYRSERITPPLVRAIN